MTYSSYFRNFDNEPIGVVIVSDNTQNILTYKPYQFNAGVVSGHAQKELLLNASDPVTITLNQSDNVLSPLKLQSCTISMYTDEFIPDFYSQITNNVSVKVYNIATDEILFIGYVTPEVYTQPFIGNDSLEIECVGGISILENFPYTIIGSQPEIQPIEDIVSNVLSRTGIYNFSNIEENSGFDYIFNKGYQLYEQNFFDDDEEQTPWTCKDVLEQICLFFGVSLVEHRGKIYFVDYLRLKNSNADSKELAFYINHPDLTTFAGNDTTLSLDSTYQKITVVDNQYPVSDTMDIEEMIGAAQVITLPNKYHGTETKPEDYDFFVHEGVDYIQPSQNVGSPGWPVLRQILDNTFVLYLLAWGSNKKNVSFLQLYSNPATLHSYYYPDGGWYMENEATTMPTSITYKDLQTFVTGILCKVDNKEVDSFNDVVPAPKLKPALLLTVHSNGTATQNEWGVYAFFAFQPLWKYTDKVTKVNRNTKKYFYINFSCNFNYSKQNTGKCTGGGDVSSKDILNHPPRFCTTVRVTKTNGDIWYIGGTGLSSSPYELDSTSGKWNGHHFEAAVGEYSPYWSLSNWHKESNNPSQNFQWKKVTDGKDYSREVLKNENEHYCERFFIYPDWEGGTQYINGNLSLMSNITWTMGIDKTDGIAIPFDKFDIEEGDTLEVIFYKPVALGADHYLDSVLLTDLEIDILEENADKIENGNERSDVIYTNTDNRYNANGTYIGEFNDLELKINTQQSDMPQSYSSVLKNGLFVENMVDPSINNTDYVQEQNLVEKYLRHFGTPKMLITTSQNFCPTPIEKMYYLNKEFLLDGYEFDPKQNITQLNIFEY